VNDYDRASVDLDFWRGVRNAIVPTVLLWVAILFFATKACAGDNVLLKTYALSGIAADTYTTLANNPYASIEERNPLMRRADGSASPTRLIALKGVQTTVVLYALHKSPRSRVVRWTVLAVSSFDWWTAYHNARLPRSLARR